MYIHNHSSGMDEQFVHVGRLFLAHTFVYTVVCLCKQSQHAPLPEGNRTSFVPSPSHTVSVHKLADF